jgi:polyisoprenoid-binding protein YceI
MHYEISSSLGQHGVLRPVSFHVTKVKLTLPMKRVAIIGAGIHEFIQALQV